MRLAPRDASARSNRAEHLRRAGRLGEAEAGFRRALALDPDLPQALLGLGTTLKATGRPAAADAPLTRAAELRPHHPATLFNLGNLCLEQHRLGEALALYGRVVRLDPRHAGAHNNAGAALQLGREMEQAERAYGEAERVATGTTPAPRNLGSLLAETGRTDEARRAFTRALHLRPDDAFTRLRLGTLVPPVMPSEQAIDDYRARARAALEAFEPPLGATGADVLAAGAAPPFDLIYHGRNDVPIKTLWAERFRPFLPEREPPQTGGKPHIGFVATHGHEDVFTRCMAGTLNRLPADRLRVTFFCGSAQAAQRLRPAFEPHVSVRAIPGGVESADAELRASACDVLAWWNVSGDALNYIVPFLRPARVQMLCWGSCFTCGVDSVEWALSSEGMETPGSQARYSERLVTTQRVPVCYARPTLPDELAGREAFGVAPDQRLYACIQNVRKVHPRMHGLIGEILRRDPGGVALFTGDRYPAAVGALRDALHTALPDVADRIRVLPRLERARYHGLIAGADVVLDTPHYCGGANTFFDALAHAAPVVTLPGATQRSRYTAASYAQIDLHELSARTPDAYVRTALDVAADPDRRAALADRIRSRAPELFDDAAPVAELADWLEQVARDARR